jgi:hypothetical protein
MYVDELKEFSFSLTFGRLSVNVNFNREGQIVATVHLVLVYMFIFSYCFTYIVGGMRITVVM